MTDERSGLIGTSVQRTDALEKALGLTQYGQDFWLPDTLYGGVLRSRHPVARIVSINSSAAEQLPGVHTVMTSKDIPGRKTYGGPLKLDHPVLAEDKVLYLGQAIALVAAETRDLVEQALNLIEVEYEELPAVFDPLEAIKPDAPKIGPDGNVANHLWLDRGSVEQGFSEADVVVEDIYRTTWVDHAALEVECGMAWIDEAGGITIRVPTQAIEYYQQVAAVLDLPPSKVRVICPMVGGGFGRKLDITVELYLALLTWQTGRPIYLESSREESITAYSKRHPFVMHYKTGATRDGRLTAVQATIWADAGPFVYRSALICLHSLMTAIGPYYVPHVELDIKAVYTHNTFTSAMRAVGGPQTNFAYESQIDRVALELEMDPVELRRINYLKPGQDLPNGQTIDDAIMLAESAERALQALGDPSPSAGSKKIGRGISSNIGGWGFPDNNASCEIELQDDGSTIVSIGVPDIGGGQSSSVAQVVADILGVSLDSISLHISDTATTPLVGPTAGSKTLYYCGNAASIAANEIRMRLLDVASDLIEARPEDLDVDNGQVFVKGQPSSGIPLTQVIAEAQERGIELRELSTFKTPAEQKFDPETGTGIDWLGFTFGTHAVEVEVDEETGEVTILKYAVCHDVGRAVHPQSVEGQMEGGVAQGLGFTLTEEVIIRDGITLTPSLREYLIPTSSDVPDITSIILESGEGLGVFSNRGIGEPPAAATAGAIANAIYDAVGVRITELPITPERVFNALQRRQDQAK